MSHKRATLKAFNHAKDLRRNQTPAEQRLWEQLRNHRLNGLGFRRQHALGQFVVDFCCPARKLTIELDGASHANQVEYDAARTGWLEERGWHELRFTNWEVEQNLGAVLRAILEAAESLL